MLLFIGVVSHVDGEGEPLTYNDYRYPPTWAGWTSRRLIAGRRRGTPIAMSPRERGGRAVGLQLMLHIGLVPPRGQGGRPAGAQRLSTIILPRGRGGRAVGLQLFLHIGLVSPCEPGGRAVVMVAAAACSGNGIASRGISSRSVHVAVPLHLFFCCCRSFPMRKQHKCR